MSELEDIFLAGVGVGVGGLRILLSPHHAPLHRCFRWITMAVVVFIVCPGSCGGGGGDGGLNLHLLPGCLQGNTKSS